MDMGFFSAGVGAAIAGAAAMLLWLSLINDKL